MISKSPDLVAPPDGDGESNTDNNNDGENSNDGETLRVLLDNQTEKLVFYENFTITGSKFISNQVSNDGGAIYVLYQDVGIYGSDFMNNIAGKFGGAIVVE